MIFEILFHGFCGSKISVLRIKGVSAEKIAEIFLIRASIFLRKIKLVSGDYFGGREQPKLTATRARFSEQENERLGLSRWQGDPR